MKTSTTNRVESWQCIPHGVIQLVSATYGLHAGSLVTDARAVATWRGSNDDLLALIDARRGLGADGSVSYLRLLRTALAVGASSVTNQRRIAGTD